MFYSLLSARDIIILSYIIQQNFRFVNSIRNIYKIYGSFKRMSRQFADKVSKLNVTAEKVGDIFRSRTRRRTGYGRVRERKKQAGTRNISMIFLVPKML